MWGKRNDGPLNSRGNISSRRWSPNNQDNQAYSENGEKKNFNGRQNHTIQNLSSWQPNIRSQSSSSGLNEFRHDFEFEIANRSGNHTQSYSHDSTIGNNELNADHFEANNAEIAHQQSAPPQDEFNVKASASINVDKNSDNNTLLLCQPTHTTEGHPSLPTPEFIYIDEVEWADPNDSSNNIEKATRPKFTPSDGPCGCTKDSFNNICCLNTSCVLFACQEECRSDCLAGDSCGNKRITQKKWKKLNVIDAGPKGKGLQVLEDIQRSDFIIEYCGVAVQKKYLESVFRKYKTERMLYIMALDTDIYIDARKKGNTARFINHSCEPNCVVHRWKVRGVNRAAVFALRDISAGEELTFDYKWERKIGRAPTKCHCNTSECRGTLELPREEDEDELDEMLNGNWIPPPIGHIFKDELVDKTIKVFVKEEREYFLADICKYDPDTGRHCLMYRGDADECWEDLRSTEWMLLDDETKEFFISKKNKLSSNYSSSTNQNHLDWSLSKVEKDYCIFLSDSLKNKLGPILQRCQKHHRVQITMISIAESDNMVDLFTESQDNLAEPSWKFIITGKNPAVAKEYLEMNIRSFIEKNEAEVSITSAAIIGSNAIFTQEMIVPRCIFETLKSHLPRLKSAFKNIDISFTHSESKAKIFAKLKFSGIKTNVQYAVIAVWRDALSICQSVKAPCHLSGHYQNFAFYGGTLTDLEFQQLFFPKTLQPFEKSFDIRDSFFLKAFEDRYHCTIWIQSRVDMIHEAVGLDESNDSLKIYFGCDPRRVEELWDTLKARIVSEINEGVEYLDLGQNIRHLPFLADSSRKVPFFCFVEHVAGVHVCIDPFTRSLLKISPVADNTKGCRLAREIILLQIELLRDFHAHHQRRLFGREWSKVDMDVMSIKPDFPSKHRLISNSCQEISKIVRNLKLNSIIAAHACIIFYRYLRQAGSDLLNNVTQTRLREILIACIYLANKSQKICRWKRLHIILQASFSVFYGDSSKDLNNPDVWEKRVLAFESELLSTLKLDLFWMGMDSIYSISIEEGKISEPLAANVMDITLSGPVLAMGAQLWLDLGPEYAFTAVAALLSIHIDTLFDSLSLLPHKFVAAIDLIVSSCQSFDGINSKDSKQGQDLFGGVKSLNASKEVIMEKLRNRSFDRDRLSDGVIRKHLVAKESLSRKVLRVANQKFAHKILVPNLPNIHTDSECDIFFECPLGSHEVMDFILEGHWRSICLAEYYLFSRDEQIIVEDVSDIYKTSPNGTVLSSPNCLKPYPGMVDSSFISNPNMLNVTWMRSHRNLSSTITGNVCKVARDVLFDSNLRWWSSSVAALNGSLTSLLQITSLERCKEESIIDELALIADALSTEKNPRSKTYPLLNMYANIGACVVDAVVQVNKTNFSSSMSLKRWPPRKVENKESTKNESNVGFSPSALQEMQLLHQIHLSVPSPRGHPNFVLPLSIAFSGGYHKKEKNIHEVGTRSTTAIDIVASSHFTDGLLTPSAKTHQDDFSAQTCGNYLMCSPTPFTLQAVLTLRKRKIDSQPMLEVSPVIIRLWFRDLLSALCHSHSNHVVFRTLHPSQIYIDNSGTAKIGNLYRCHVLHPEERNRVSTEFERNHKPRKGDKEAIDAGDIRSNSYLAPELLFGSSRYTQQSDIWALGCMMAHVILDKVLFHGKDRHAVTHAMFKIVGSPSADHVKMFAHHPHFKAIISSGESSKAKKYKKNVAKALRSMMIERSLDTDEYEEIFELLELMLDLDPSKRISASDALEHVAMRNLSPTVLFCNRFVHDWTHFKKQYELCLRNIISSDSNDTDDLYSDDDDNMMNGYNRGSKTKGNRNSRENEALDYFDIDEIMNSSLMSSVASKRIRNSIETS